MQYKIIYTNQALKDLKKVKYSPFYEKVQQLLSILRDNPFQNPPEYKELSGDLAGYFSRRINFQHRLVYQVYEMECTVKIIRMWSHYE